jgi:hypothetical protein
VTWAIVVVGVGAGISAYGSYSSSKAQKDALGYQEKEAEMNAQLQGKMAEDAIARGNRDAQDHMQKAAMMKSSQKAAIAANGIDVSQGSPASILDDTDYMAKVDVGRIKGNAQREAWGYKVGQRNANSTALMLDAQGDSINPGMNALMSGVSSVASNWGMISSGGSSSPSSGKGSGSSGGGK